MSLKYLVSKITEDPIYTFERVSSKLDHRVKGLFVTLSPWQTSSKVIVNQRKIRVVGLRRSGNHIITNWIKNQLIGMVVYLNNIPVDENPYRRIYSSAKSKRHDSQTWWKQFEMLNYPQYQGEEGKQFLQEEARGNFKKKDFLICSYEDYDFNQITNTVVERNCERYFGKSAEKYDVLILRDPFNMLASRFKNNYIKVKSLNKTLIDMWISYAKEYLGETDYLKNNKIVVNYNRFVSNMDYRKKIAFQLKLKFDDSGIDEVSNLGGGSSFNRCEFNKQGSKMDILNRWRNFSEDMSYRILLNNEELIEYSKRIFGHIPDTESLRIR